MAQDRVPSTTSKTRRASGRRRDGREEEEEEESGREGEEEGEGQRGIQRSGPYHQAQIFEILHMARKEHLYSATSCKFQAVAQRSSLHCAMASNFLLGAEEMALQRHQVEFQAVAQGSSLHCAMALNLPLGAERTSSLRHWLGNFTSPLAL